MFPGTYSFDRMLFPGAFRAAHPSATYADTNRKEAQTLSLPLSSAHVRPWSPWKPRTGSIKHKRRCSLRSRTVRGGGCPQGTPGALGAKVPGDHIGRWNEE